MNAGIAGRPDPRADRIGRATNDRAWFALSFTIAAGAHVAMMLGLHPRAHEAAAPPPMLIQVIDIEPSEPPHPPAPSPQPLALPEPEPSRPRRPVSRSARAAREDPRPAADVMTRSAGQDEPLDFTTGSAPSYAGGSSDRIGDIPAADRQRPKATSSGGRASAGAGSDRSRRVSVADDLDWNCPFPSEADGRRIDHGSATLRVAIDAGGLVRRVEVLRDSGHGFGRAAKSCALARRYRTARDRHGRDIPGTLVVRVRFVR
jgi:protein TonB